MFSFDSFLSPLVALFSPYQACQTLDARAIMAIKVIFYKFEINQALYSAYEPLINVL